MLKLVNIKKDYKLADTTVHALKGVSLEFRKNEFVSILGQSGCGKTTLLNIIGGLDKYTSGDLVINGTSTKEYKDRDWDTYRNHSVGFVFQSYNLIPHQTVLENVELALTLSGISKAERLKRATAVLTKVGLGDKLNSRPNQLSGGQMQRVAIARALINDPEILLADEPTGALDSKTSTQIMDLLKEISNDRLIIMVTHNPDLAEEYSSRIIRLLDGKVTDDSNPYDSKKDDVLDETNEKLPENTKKVNTEVQEKQKSTGIKKSTSSKTKKTSMSFFTALSLSLKNLLTKKARTFMVSFAGSIGIIGIALILSLSSGFQAYIDSVQKDTLSSYPVTITNASSNTSSLLTSMMEASAGNIDHELDKVYENDMLVSMFSDIASSVHTNDLKSFKAYLDSHEDIANYVTAIQYSYDLDINIYYDNGTENKIINPTETVADAFTQVGATIGGEMEKTFETMAEGLKSMTNNIFTEMLDNDKLLKEQYNLVDGRWPTAKDELVLVLDKNNEIYDYILYALNLKENSLYNDLMVSILESTTPADKLSSMLTMMGLKPKPTESTKIDYSTILEDFDYKLVLPTDKYTFSKDAENNPICVEKSKEEYENTIKNAESLKIVGIIKPNPDAAAHSINGTIAYTKELTEYYANKINNTDMVKWQKANTDRSVYDGKDFTISYNNAKLALTNYLTTPEAQTDMNSLTYLKTLQLTTSTVKKDANGNDLLDEDNNPITYTQEEIEEETIKCFGMLPNAVKEPYTADLSSKNYAQIIRELNVISLDTPSGISIYPVDFESKDRIIQIIKDYNKMVTEDPEKGEAYIIEYTDYIGVMMSGITDIINAITYILIAFVAVSLIVSSIMIAIITYISVLERTKEIGILRAMGASKKDVSRIFNAETFLIGLTAGLFGVGITILLNIPINMVISALSGLNGVASLPIIGGIVLVLISVALSMIAGLIPSRIASKKDPVIALRTE
ncbi:MAG: ABC transporter ATP-binding protein/permease [Clostridia bacterium]|nr:ABC transporter ATP-binding protein/permease [Clostridia bacterium]